MKRDSVDVVVFDAVGTLIYADPDVASAYATTARKFGSKLDRTEIERRFRRAFDDEEARDRQADARTSESIERQRWRRIVQRVLSDVTSPAACFSELFSHFARAESWRVFDDVPAMLEHLRSFGCRIGIASNFDCRLFQIVRGLECLSQLDFVLVSSEIGFRKPHRRFFEAILSKLVVEPARVLYVGDDPQNDMAGARAVGMQAILVARDGQNGHTAVRSLSELAVLIG